MSRFNVMTVDEALRAIHAKHGDFYAELTVEESDGHLNFNIALSKTETDEAIGILSYNGHTAEAAFEKATSA